METEVTWRFTMIGLNAGTHVANYTLAKPLGEGGQGSVWEAYATNPASHGPTVALKIVSVRGSPPTIIERLRREAESLVRLSNGHPSLVGCQGVVQDDALGVFAIVMEKVDGVDWFAALRDPRFTEQRKFMALGHVARALAHLHAAGVVHRDIKPQNILITHRFFDTPDDGSTVRVVDFGIAISTGNPRPLTEIGTVIGTPAYMAPERVDPLYWQGQAGLPTEDIWAFGIVAYEAFFGHHPSGVTSDVASLATYAERYRVISKGADPWPRVPPGHPATTTLRSALALPAAQRLPHGEALVAVLMASRTVSDRPMASTGAPVIAKGRTEPEFAAISTPGLMVTTPERGRVDGGAAGNKTEVAFLPPAVFGGNAPRGREGTDGIEHRPAALAFSPVASSTPYAHPYPVIPPPTPALSGQRPRRAPWIAPVILLALAAGGGIPVAFVAFSRSSADEDNQPPPNLGSNSPAPATVVPVLSNVEPGSTSPVLPSVPEPTRPKQPASRGSAKPKASSSNEVPLPGATPPVVPPATTAPTAPPAPFPFPPAAPATTTPPSPPPTTPPAPLPTITTPPPARTTPGGPPVIRIPGASSPPPAPQPQPGGQPPAGTTPIRIRIPGR